MKSQRAVASFSIESWEDQTISEEGGIRIYRTHLTKRFDGDIKGESVGDMVMVHINGTPAAYCGFERITGRLADRGGEFLLQHTASAGVEGGLEIKVVTGSGTGELQGLTGTARIGVSGEASDSSDAGHTVMIDYVLGSG